MLKKLILGVASSFLLMGAANAGTIIVNDGTDNDDAGGVTAIASVTPAALSVAGGPVTFGGAIGGTDVNAVDNSVAHRFTDLIATAGGAITGGTLTIVFSDFLAGSANDRVLAGFGVGGTTIGTAYTTLSSAVQADAGTNQTLVIDLAAAGFLAGLNSNNFFDVLITDDSVVDFISLEVVSAIPVPGALPLMASALIGGAAAMRRRRKQA